MERHFRELDEQGYTILENLLSPEQVEEAIETLQRLYAGDKQVSAHEPHTQRMFNLTARAEIFREIIQLPRLVACMEYLLGPDYILSDMGARSPMPGIGPQGLHRDGGGFLPNPPVNAHAILPIAAQSMIALSEFTPMNGATRLVPGSHNRDIDPAKVTPEDERQFLCAPGTALIYDNRLIHGGGAHTGDSIRYSLQGFCCRKIIKPFCDHTRSLPPSVVETASPLMRRLWGFEYQSAWEETDQDFRIVDAPGAKPVFNYNHGRTRTGQ